MAIVVSIRSLVAAAALTLLPHAVLAQANDNWANRTVIAALPFTVTETQMPSASVEVTDPDPPCREVFANPTSKTLWYGFTTGGSAQYLNLEVTDYDVVAHITVYSGTPGSFRIVSGACASAGDPPNNNAELRGLRLAPNTSYSIMVSDGFPLNPSDELNFSVTAAPLYQVTKTADTLDGTCNADCSLREAIAASNAAPGAVLIPAGTYAQTRAGSGENNNVTGDFDATASMGIYGAGMGSTIIDGGLLDRGLDLVQTPGFDHSFALGDLSVVHGRAPSTGSFETRGGGIRAYCLGGEYVGLERIGISDGAAQLGGALYLTCPGTIRDSRFSDSAAQFGGGLDFGYEHSRPLEITGSTFDGNIADVSGGGANLAGGVAIVNSTFSGNHAEFTGGGIESANSTLRLFSSTIAFNSSGGNQFADERGAGLHFTGPGDAANVLANNIIAGNTATNPADAPDCAAIEATPLGSHHNHVHRNKNCAFTGTGDVVGTDPLVYPGLLNLGGLTPVHPLIVGSTAINAGDPAGCKDATGATLAFDQRGAGFPRVLGPACDKGAVEEVAKIAQAITNFASTPTSPVYNPGSQFSVSSTPGGSGNPVVYASSSTGVCTIISNTVTIVTAGTCVLTANQAGNGSYYPAPQVTLNVTIAKANQAITNFASTPTSPTFAPGGTFTVSATPGASSSALVFSSGSTGICTVSGTTVTMVAAGTCVLRADQAADTNYNAAPQVPLNVTIAKASQSITNFASTPTNPVFSPGGTFSVSATPGGSTSPLVFASTTTGICTVSGTTVTIVAAGQCALTANQAADTSYNAAPQVGLNVTIAKANQAITNFAASPPAPLFSAGGTFSVSATPGASSSPLVFASTSTGICTVSGTTVTMVAEGNCTLTVNQAADGNYNAAPQLTLGVTLGTQGPLLVDGFEG